MVIKDSREGKDANSNVSSDDDSTAMASAAGMRCPHGDPNAGTGDPTHGRDRFEWSTPYPPKALAEMRWEPIYLLFLFFSSLLLIVATWVEWTTAPLRLSPEEAITFKKYAYYAASGMLGGVVFGIEYFYRVVARGGLALGSKILEINVSPHRDDSCLYHRSDDRR